jgi:hypothetical protein
MNTEKQLSQLVPHPEEPVDELTYILHSHQNVRVVSILTKLFILTSLLGRFQNKLHACLIYLYANKT